VLLKLKNISLIAIILISSAAHNAHANQFTAKDFLEFSQGQRQWWYMGSIDALGLVVSQGNKEQADCIWNWYFADKDAKSAFLDKKMKSFPQHSPSAIITGLLHKDCGKFSVKGAE